MNEEKSNLMSIDCSNENLSTVNLQVFVCSVCGGDHETEHCAVVQSLKLVPDSEILSRARLTLPKNLDVMTLADGTTAIVTNKRIEQGTQFGPFQAPLTLNMHPAVSFPLKVFGKNSSEGYYLDTTDEESCNWMCLVAVATTNKEQNLICYDIKQHIYFTTTRDVQPGEELRVWYALYYGLKLQAFPLSDDSPPEEGFSDVVDEEVEDRLRLSDGSSIVLGEDLLQTLAQHLPAHALGAAGERDVWLCKLCGGQESNVASYARHLMAHYRQQEYDIKHPQCKICFKRFLGKKVLVSHILKAHQADKGQLPKVTPLTASPSQMQEFGQMQHSEQNAPLNEELLIKDFQSVALCSDSFDKKTCDQGDSIIPGCCVSSNRQQNQVKMYTAEKDKCDFKTEIFYGKKSVDDTVNNAVQPDKSSGQCLSEESRDKNKEVILLSMKPSELNDDAASCIKPTLSSSVSIDGKQLESSPSVEAINVHEDHKNDKSESFIHSPYESNVSTSFDFVEAQAIDGSLEIREPITFLMVNSEVQNTDINVDNISILQTDSHGSNSSNQQESLFPNSKEELPCNKILSYDCDICHKSFGKCSYLYRHLRKHTGEFTCVSCLAVFARKENLQAHSCAQPKEWFPCQICGKKFSAKKYLQRHNPIHTGEFTCPHCSRSFVSRLSLKVHRCPSTKSSPIKAVSCFMCERVFDSQLKLQSHLKVHSSTNTQMRKSNIFKPPVGSQQCSQRKCQSKESIGNSEQKSSETNERKVFICEVCGAIFKSSSSMKTHRFLHGERKFECEVCKKRFHRKDVLQEHLTVHQEASFPCHMCGKKYKTKKSLHVHSLIHKGAKRFVCRVCGKEFFQKGNLFKHEQTHTSERTQTCRFCNKSFTSKEYFNLHELTHTQGKIYSCDECKKSFVKKHMLDTHRQLFHSNRGYLCKYCNSVIRHKHSIRRHLEMRHTDHRQEWSIPGFIDLLLAELPQSLTNLSGDGRLTPSQQQERLQLLESLRKKHFQKMASQSTGPEERNSSSDFIFSSTSPTEPQICQLTQVDPLMMLQSSQQLTFIDNLLPDYGQAHASTNATCSLMVSGELPGTEGEILLTLVDQDSLNSSCIKNTTPVLTSAALGSDMIGLDSGATYMVDDGTGNNSVLLYVVETSNGDDGDSQDIVWSNDVA